MLRFLIFFVAVFFLTGLLAQVPLVGGLFRIPFLGFWFTAILLSAVLAKAGTEAVDAGRRRALERSLGSVDTPHHKGKLAGLHLSQGRARRALPLFREALEMDPESLEWRYGFARAAAAVGGDERVRGLEVLEGLLAEDEEHGYGAAMLLAARLDHSLARHDAASERIARFERNHGPAPESALLRARVERARGNAAAEAAALDEAAALASSHPGTRGSRGWTFRWRLRIARWFG